MNYRHIFHAGNFADLLKHAVLLEILSRLTGPRCGPLTVIDTHAGAGVYDLECEAARRSGEGAAIVALMADAQAPAVFDPLKAAVRRLNESGARHYPGSPLLIAEALRPSDRLFASETGREAFDVLRQVLRGPALAVREDGWTLARRRAGKGPSLLLVDPPYEAADDGARTAALVGDTLASNREAVIAIWAPIKDLTSFDALASSIEDAGAGRPVLVIEARLRPADDPLRLNGCAMIVVNPPPGLDVPARSAADWIVQAFGAGLGESRVTLFSGSAGQGRTMA